MDDEERKRLIRQIEREIYYSHLLGQLPPNFSKTLIKLEAMGIDPDELLDNAFFKFELLEVLSEIGVVEPVDFKKIDLSEQMVFDFPSQKETLGVLKSGLKSFTVTGDSMVDAGIVEGDIVLVGDEPFEDGGIYVVQVEDYFFVKRVERTRKGFRLISENHKYPPVEIPSNLEIQIIGKVKYIVKKVK